MFSLKSIFQRFTLKILGTFGLILLESAIIVAQPFMVGVAINDLLDGSMRGVLSVGFLYAGSLVIGTLRRMYDTRTYSKIYASIAPEMIRQQRENAVANSAIVSRSALVKELVDFFENDMTQGIMSLIKMIGAVVMLFVLDYRLFIGCVAALGLIYLVYMFSEKNVFKSNQDFNDEFENQVDVITSNDPQVIKEHYNSLARWQIQISDLEAINFGLIEAIITALAIFSLFIAMDGSNPTAGGIFSIFSYTLEFGESVYILPWIFQQIIRLKEISLRLENHTIQKINI